LKNLKLYLACAACALAVSVSAQTTPSNSAPDQGAVASNQMAGIPLVTFTDDQLGNLIQVATKDCKKRCNDYTGLRLFDKWATIQALSDKTGETSSGFSLNVYAAPSWIEHKAIESAHLMETFTPASVTPDMRMDVIRVLAWPSTTVALTGGGLDDTSNVSHIVMQDVTRTIVIQPIAESDVTEEENSARRSVTVHGKAAVFAQADVKRIRGADGEGEFFITVIGDNERRSRKDFKVKSKDFDKLVGK
jgi:hypothetical protein